MKYWLDQMIDALSKHNISFQRQKQQGIVTFTWFVSNNTGSLQPPFYTSANDSKETANKELQTSLIQSLIIIRGKDEGEANHHEDTIFYIQEKITGIYVPDV